jgi:hydroxymethylbilane synthase
MEGTTCLQTAAAAGVPLVPAATAPVVDTETLMETCASSHPSASAPLARLTIATRGSRLALWQAEHIRAAIHRLHPDLPTDLLVLKTKGDMILDAPLAKLGGKGLFVKEIEEALLDGRAHIAVHSIKDLPADLPAGLALGAIPAGEAPEDMLLSVRHAQLESLPQGALVGTSSLRRQAQLLALRPDLRVRTLRGNVDTRLRKLQEGEFDAIVMAAAGMRRLGLHAPQEHELSVKQFLPAAGQGALGLEYATRNTALAPILACLDHLPTRLRVEAERAFLAELGGGCQTPIAAHACLKGQETLCLDGLVASPDGKRLIRRQMSGPADKAGSLGITLAVKIKAEGGGEILREFSHCPTAQS